MRRPQQRPSYYGHYETSRRFVESSTIHAVLAATHRDRDTAYFDIVTLTCAAPCLSISNILQVTSAGSGTEAKILASLNIYYLPSVTRVLEVVFIHVFVVTRSVNQPHVASSHHITLHYNVTCSYLWCGNQDTDSTLCYRRPSQHQLRLQTCNLALNIKCSSRSQELLNVAKFYL